MRWMGSPGSDAGRGLKLRTSDKKLLVHLGSPGSDAGRGLKPVVGVDGWARIMDRPAVMPGAD